MKRGLAGAQAALIKEEERSPQNARSSFVPDWQMVVHFNAMRRPVAEVTAMVAVLLLCAVHIASCVYTRVASDRAFN